MNDFPSAVRRIGLGLWLLDLLRMHADPSTGLVAGGNVVTTKELGERLGYSPATIRRWIKALRSFGLVRAVPWEGGYVFSIRPQWMAESSEAPAPTPTKRETERGTQWAN